MIQELAESVSRYPGHLYADVLMSNHYHLLLETPRGNVSRLLQHLNTSYTVSLTGDIGATSTSLKGDSKRGWWKPMHICITLGQNSVLTRGCVKDIRFPEIHFLALFDRWRFFRFQLDVAVVLHPRAGGNESAHNDVLL